MATTVPLKAVYNEKTGGAINYASDTLKALLVVAGSGAPSVTHTGVETVADVTATNSEVTGTGYARQTLSGQAIAYDSETVTFTFSSITFSMNAAGFTNARYLVLYKDGASDAARKVFAICDLVSDRSVTSGDLTLSAPSGGLLVWSN